MLNTHFNDQGHHDRQDSTIGELVALMAHDHSSFNAISIDGNIRAFSFARLNSLTSFSIRKAGSRLDSFRASLRQALSKSSSEAPLGGGEEEAAAKEAESTIETILAITPSDSIENTIRDWVKDQGLLTACFELNLIAGGLTNWAFHLKGEKESILVKYVKPDAKLVPGVSLDVCRMFSEAHGLKIGSKSAPDLVPKWIAQHTTASGDGMVAMAFLPDRNTLSEVIFEQGRVIPGLGTKIGAGLARISVGSSLASLGRKAFDEQREILKASESVSTFMLDHISNQVFRAEMISGENFCSWPEEDDALLKTLIFENSKLLEEVKSLQCLMANDATSAEESNLSLVHLDVWLNNLLASSHEETEVSLIDFEFSRLGSAALDVGQVIQQFLTAAIVVKGLADHQEAIDGQPTSEQRAKQCGWLLASAKEAWEAFESSFETARREISDQSLPLPTCPPLADVIGFCGMISLVRGGLSEYSTIRINLGGSGNPHCDLATRRQVKVGSIMLSQRHAMTLDEIISIIERDLS